MIKTYTLSVILIFQSFSLLAQTPNTNPDFKFGKVDESEFKTQPVGRDSSASAIVLFDIGYMNFGISQNGQWVYKLERHTRIKILTKEGSSYANFTIPIFHKGKSGESLGKVQLASYNIKDGKVTQNKAAKDEKFLEQVSETFNRYKYTLSNVEVGTIVEIKYEIQSEYIHTLRDWYFQQNIPVKWSDFTLVLPEYFKYKINSQPFHPINLVESKSIRESFSSYVQGEIESGSLVSVDCNSLLNRWVSENVPAFKDEPYITTEDDYLTKIDFEIMSVQLPRSEYKSYSNTWINILEDYKKHENFGLYIKPNNFSKKLIESIIEPSDSQNIKISKIYNYVKSNLKWNGKYGDFAPEANIKNVLDIKSNNVAGINLTLINLLKTANIQVNPILLSSRDNGKHPGVPLSGKFNYVIAQVKVDSNLIFLDATNQFLKPGLINTTALNHYGLFIDFESMTHQWISLEPKRSSTTMINGQVEFDKDLKLSGNLSYRSTDYDALSRRRTFETFTNEAEYLTSFKKNKPGMNVLKFTQAGLKEIEEPYVEEYVFDLQDYVEEAGNLVYFNPMIFENTKENPFKLEERTYPIDFTYPSIENFRLIINVPEGYEVDKLPQSINYKFPDNSVSFVYSSVQSGKQVLITSKITINNSVYEPDTYAGFKELFKNIVTKQGQQLVFKKL